MPPKVRPCSSVNWNWLPGSPKSVGFWQTSKAVVPLVGSCGLVKNTPEAFP